MTSKASGNASNFCLLDKLHWVSFEPLLACHATKMIGFTVVRDLKLGCLFVQNNAANRIFWHYFTLNLIERVDLLLIMISGERINNEKVRKKIL